MTLENLKENKSVQIITIVITSYIVIAMAFYFFAINPKLFAINHISKDIKEKEGVINKSVSYDKQKEKMQRLKKMISDLNAKINYYEKMLPTEEDIPYLLQYLSQIARETDIKLMQIEKPREVKATDESLYITVPLNLTVRGGYHNVGLFVNKLENAQRFMKIEEFRISSDKNSPLEHKANILIYTYMLYDKEEKKE